MTTTNEGNITKVELLAGGAALTVAAVGATWIFYGAAISHFISELSRLTLLGLTIGGALGLIGMVLGLVYLVVSGGLTLTKKAADVGYHVAFLNEELAMKKANTLYRHAEIQVAAANSRLIDSQAMYQIQPISATKGALFIANGVPTFIPPVQAMVPQLSSGIPDELPIDDEKLFRIFAKAKAIHALILGSRNSGKSTLVNRLMNVEFQGYDTAIVDILFNRIDSGWLLHDKAKVSRDFIASLKEFHTSHKRLADTVNTSRRGATKRLLVIDEFPSLLARLKADDKKQYDDVMAMLRDIYSNGSHTNHNVILLSQTVLSEDIGLSSNDKGNFIQVALGSLAGDYLALRRGKSGNSKKACYERLAAIANEHEFYCCFEDTNGALDVQPLADLSDYGAKRLYNLADESVAVQADSVTIADSGDSHGAAKLSIFSLPEMTESEQAIITAASELIADNQFSFNKLHNRLTGQPKSGGKQNDAYKEILAKFRLLEAIEMMRT